MVYLLAVCIFGCANILRAKMYMQYSRDILFSLQISLYFSMNWKAIICISLWTEINNPVSLYVSLSHLFRESKSHINTCMTLAWHYFSSQSSNSYIFPHLFRPASSPFKSLDSFTVIYLDQWELCKNCIYRYHLILRSPLDGD